MIRMAVITNIAATATAIVTVAIAAAVTTADAPTVVPVLHGCTYQVNLYTSHGYQRQRSSVGYAAHRQ